MLADDLGPWAMGCAGNGEIRTPNLDRLAKTGTRFENFFCVSPVCSPARASILTGRMPSQHGVHDWLRYGCSTIGTWGGCPPNKPGQEEKGELIEYLKGMPGYTDVLAANGYVCGLSGKWHLGDSHHAQKGFSFWEAHARGGSPYYNAPMIRDGKVTYEPRYVTDVITDNALTFLEQRNESDAPFYLGVHYTAPHSPWDRNNHPPDLWDDYHDNCPFESTPFGLTLAKHFRKNDIPGMSEARRKATLSGYFAAITAMDANIGRLLDYLEANGLRENTLVIFSSDNGMNMGHHGVWGKGNGTFPMNMYEESVKVPTLISRPGSLSEGAVCDEMLSHYDIFPTLLDYLGLDNPEAERLPGQSFAPLLRGENMSGRGNVVVFDEYGPVRMIRTTGWKYVHRFVYGPHELYNLEDDPGETANLYGRSDMETVIKQLKTELDAFFVCYSDPLLDGSREPVTGAGQQYWAGPAGQGREAMVQRWHWEKKKVKPGNAR